MGEGSVASVLFSPFLLIFKCFDDVDVAPQISGMRLKDILQIGEYLAAGRRYKNKKVGPLSYLFSLKLTNLTKPKLMKKNVLQR
jgi:hypothetical protein